MISKHFADYQIFNKFAICRLIKSLGRYTTLPTPHSVYPWSYSLETSALTPFDFNARLCFYLLQLNAFRSMRMKTPEECCSDPHGGPQLVNNYRPPLPLGNRVLRECGAMWDDGPVNLIRRSQLFHRRRHCRLVHNVCVFAPLCFILHETFSFEQRMSTSCDCFVCV